MQWDLPLTINSSLNGCEWKKIFFKNACSRCFWQKMKSWWGKDTDDNISARSLTLLIFAVGWALYGRPQPEHESVMPLLSLSPLTVLTHQNSILCQETSSESGLLHTFFIYSRAFNNNLISNGEFYCCNKLTTLLLT